MPSNYIICTTQRSGSTYLCECLTKLVQLGTPAEWLVFLEYDDEALDPGELYLKSMLTREVVARLSDLQQATSGVRGWKLMWSTMHKIAHRIDAEEGLTLDKRFMDENFGEPQYIYYERANKLAQAISHAIMVKTGISHTRNKDEQLSFLQRKNEILITENEIDYYLNRLIRDENNWLDFFSRNDLKYLHVLYEDFCLDALSGIADIANFLGVKLAIQEADDPSKSVAVKRTRSHFEIEIAKRYLNSKLPRL